ncbi:MAG: H-type lectin domain-containing protein [Gemmatimonadaceae bacterium]|nr:H-type lectin domain-containing protein [Gemmatimonadaceae bacterium]
MAKQKRSAPAVTPPASPAAADIGSPRDSFDEKVRLAQITSQLASKVEVKKALLGAVLGILAAVAISYLTTRSALKASRVVGGQYEVALYEYAEDGTPRRGADGGLIGRSQAIIPIEFGGAFDKPPRVIVSINGVDAWGGANTRVHAYAGANATKDRSDIVVKTWGNSIVYAVQVSWVAFADVDARR